MARQINIELVDDLDGTVLGEEGQTINFAVNGVEYTIDLAPKNADAFFAALEPYIASAQKVTSTRRTSKSKTDKANDSRAVREWARENGYEISDRGRIPSHIFQAFTDAH